MLIESCGGQDCGYLHCVRHWLGGVSSREVEIYLFRRVVSLLPKIARKLRGLAILAPNTLHASNLQCIVLSTAAASLSLGS